MFTKSQHQKIADRPNFVSTFFLAEQTGYSDGAIRNWIKSGKMPGDRLGGRYVVYESDYPDWQARFPALQFPTEPHQSAA